MSDTKHRTESDENTTDATSNQPTMSLGWQRFFRIIGVMLILAVGCALYCKFFLPDISGDIVKESEKEEDDLLEIPFEDNILEKVKTSFADGKWEQSDNTSFHFPYGKMNIWLVYKKGENSNNVNPKRFFDLRSNGESMILNSFAVCIIPSKDVEQAKKLGTDELKVKIDKSETEKEELTKEIENIKIEIKGLEGDAEADKERLVASRKQLEEDDERLSEINKTIEEDRNEYNKKINEILFSRAIMFQSDGNLVIDTKDGEKVSLSTSRDWVKSITFDGTFRGKIDALDFNFTGEELSLDCVGKFLKGKELDFKYGNTVIKGEKLTLSYSVNDEETMEALDEAEKNNDSTRKEMLQGNLGWGISLRSLTLENISNEYKNLNTIYYNTFSKDKFDWLIGKKDSKDSSDPNKESKKNPWEYIELKFDSLSLMPRENKNKNENIIQFKPWELEFSKNIEVICYRAKKSENEGELEANVSDEALKNSVYESEHLSSCYNLKLFLRDTMYESWNKKPEEKETLTKFNIRSGNLFEFEIGAVQARSSTYNSGQTVPKELKFDSYGKNKKLQYQVKTEALLYVLSSKRLAIRESSDAKSSVCFYNYQPPAEDNSEQTITETTINFRTLDAYLSKEYISLLEGGSIVRTTSSATSGEREETLRGIWNGNLCLLPAQKEECEKDRVPLNSYQFMADGGIELQNKMGKFEVSDLKGYIQLVQSEEKEILANNKQIAPSDKKDKLSKQFGFLKKYSNLFPVPVCVLLGRQTKFTSSENKVAAKIGNGIRIDFKEIPFVSAQNENPIKDAETTDKKDLFANFKEPIALEAGSLTVSCLLLKNANNDATNATNQEKSKKRWSGYKIDSAVLSDNARVWSTQTSTNVEREVLTANKVEARNLGTDEQWLEASSSNTNEPVKLRYEDTVLNGRHIIVNQAKNLFSVDGRGTINLHLQGDSQSALKETQAVDGMNMNFLNDGNVTISWGRNLTFDGEKLNFTSEESNVSSKEEDNFVWLSQQNEEANSNVMFWCSELTITLQQMLSFKELAQNVEMSRNDSSSDAMKGKMPIDVDTIVFKGTPSSSNRMNVQNGIVFLKVDKKDGKEVARYQAGFDSDVYLSYKNKTLSSNLGGRINAIVPSTGLNLSPGKTNNDEKTKYDNLRINLECGGKISSEWKTNGSIFTTLEGSVNTIFLQTNDPSSEEMLRSEFPKEKREGFNDVPIFVRCAEASLLLQNLNDKNKENTIILDAHRNVEFDVGTRHCTASKLHYDRQKDVVTLEGDPCRYFEQAINGAPRENEATCTRGSYNLKTKTFETEGASLNGSF